MRLNRRLFEDTSICPICGKKALKVSAKTVLEHLADNAKIGRDIDDSFYMCVNTKCDISYFNGISRFYIEQIELSEKSAGDERNNYLKKYYPFLFSLFSKSLSEEKYMNM